MRKKFYYPLSYLWSASILSAVTFSFFVVNKQNSSTVSNVNQSISLQDEKKLINQADSQTNTTIGSLRRWQNNNFTGIQLADGGFAVLTGNNTSGYSASRTNSFGGVLWTYNPQTYNADPNLVAGNDSSSNYTVSGIKDKAVVEIRQDSQNLSTYYALLVPKQVLDNNSAFADISFEQLKNPNLQASVIQIQENLNDINNSFKVTAFANISPESMVQNYPNTWKVANGPTFFSVLDHQGWFSSGVSPTMVMQGNYYLANIGNMYIANGYVLIFGGNGSEFAEPEALSIGIFRINFNDLKNIEVTGIPYAYVLAGLAAAYYPGRVFSRLPVGQNATFSYVPRIAVGGISTYPGVDSGQSQMIFLAGSITVGQDESSWLWAASKNKTGANGVSYKARPTVIGLSANPTSTTTSIPLLSSSSSSIPTEVKGFGSYGDQHYATSGTGTGGTRSEAYTVRWNSMNTSTVQTNYIPRSPLKSSATQKNSIDPLTLAGFKLNLSQILNLQTNTINDVTSKSSNRSYLYIIDSSYIDFGINQAFTMGYYLGTNTRNENSYTGTTGGNGQNGRPQQAFDGGLGMFTSLFGYSPKSVGNLLPYDSKLKGKDGRENNLGFVMQVGAFIYFFNLTGYDGYTQLSSSDFSPIIDEPTAGLSAPRNPASMAINASNAGEFVKYYSYVLMPSSAYNYDARIGVTSSYFDGETNQLAGINSSKLAQVKPWKDFVGLSVINADQASVVSVWSSQSGNSSVYVNDGFKSVSFNNDGNTLATSVSTASNSISVNAYPTSGSFLINGGATQGATMNNLTDNPGSDSSLNQLSAVISSPNQIRYYFQQNGSGINYYIWNPISIQLAASFKDAATDLRRYLGSGSFIRNPGDAITTKSISDIYDDIDGLHVLKGSLFKEIFTYQRPTSFISDKQTNMHERIILSNINVVTQTATFTAQVKNPFTDQYEIIPGSLDQVNQNANVTYDNFFGKQPSYLLAVAVAVPLIVVALVVGLGFGIGIPISKNKKALKQGFDISNKKVDTLTTAVGSVFKQIINQTQISNIKKTPQMLKAKTKPETSTTKNKPSAPSAKPVAPKKIIGPNKVTGIKPTTNASGPEPAVSVNKG